MVNASTYDITVLKELGTSTIPALKALNARRLRLVSEQAEQSNPIALSAVTRSTACPAPVAPVAGKEKPTLGQDFPSSEDYYPWMSKTAQAEGKVTVRATISDTGCVVRAEISGTSGVRDLDQGALALAMDGSYAPGSKDGKAVPGELMFRINFEMHE
jgi:periplasmic protein TonB